MQLGYALFLLSCCWENFSLSSSTKTLLSLGGGRGGEGGKAEGEGGREYFFSSLGPPSITFENAFTNTIILLF